MISFYKNLLKIKYYIFKIIIILLNNQKKKKKPKNKN